MKYGVNRVTLVGNPSSTPKHSKVFYTNILYLSQVSNTVNIMKINKVSEVKLVYKNRIKVGDRIRIKTSLSAFNLFWDYWDKESIEHVEEVLLLLLNRSNSTIGIVSISKGGTAGCIMDTKVILQYALKTNSHSIILAHNHPSCNTSPSDADIKVTKQISSACKLLDISLLDHLIITPDKSYLSLADEGLF